MSIYINHNTNDISTNAGAKVTSGGNTVITSADAATDAAAGIVELATTAEVQTGTDTGRVPAVSTLREGLLVSGTAIATTTGTSHDFTGIPSWVKEIHVLFSGTSTNGTDLWLVQIGDSGGIETTGYQSGSVAGATQSTSTSGFIVRVTAAAETVHGGMTLRKVDGNTWSSEHNVYRTSTAVNSYGSGGKTLSDVLTQVRLTTTGGTDTFDAGLVNILYK